MPNDIGPETIALASKLAGDVRQLKRRQRDQARANHSGRRSVTGSLPIRDQDGNTRVKVGAQTDGTVTVQEFGGDPLEEPSAPIVEERDGALVVTFDGFDAADLASYATRADFSHIGVHVSTEEGFSLADDEPLARLTNPGGESATLALPGGTMFYLKLVAYTRSGVASPASVEVAGTPYSPGTIPPSSSPSVTVTGTVDSLIVEAGRPLTPGNRLQYHISTDHNFDPLVTGAATQYGPETTATIGVITTTAASVALDPTVVYAVRVLEVNDAGAAPAAGGPQLGQLNPMKTISDFIIEGVANYINGLVTLRSGVGDPTELATITSNYETLTVGDAFNARGLGILGDASRAWVMADYLGNAGSVIFRSRTTGQNIAGFSVLAEWVPVGGVTCVGDRVYVLAARSTLDGWSRTNWRVLIYSLTGTYLGAHTPAGVDTTGSSSRPMIGNTADDTNYVIGYVNQSTLYAREYTAATGAAVSVRTLSTEWGDADVCGVARHRVPTATGAPGAVDRLVVASAIGVSVWTLVGGQPSVRVAGEDWLPGSTATTGICRDSQTGLWYSARDGAVYTHTNNSGATDFTYSWADTDPGGAGLAETKPAPVKRIIPRRMARWAVAVKVPPDDGTPDGADAAYVYAAPAGSGLVRQGAALTGGASAMTLSSIATAGDAPKAQSGFAGRVSTAIGRLASAATDLSGALVDLRGDGSWRLGDLAGAASGRVKHRDTSLPVTTRVSASFVAGVATVTIPDRGAVPAMMGLPAPELGATMVYVAATERTSWTATSVKLRAWTANGTAYAASLSGVVLELYYP